MDMKLPTSLVNEFAGDVLSHIWGLPFGPLAWPFMAKVAGGSNLTRPFQRPFLWGPVYIPPASLKNKQKYTLLNHLTK